jgi:hypothetical protein
MPTVDLYYSQSLMGHFQERINYAANGRTRVKSWNVTVQAMDSMLLWTHRFVQDQTQGHYGSYGYVIYSSNVDNCGSFAIKCLHEAGIDITLTGLKSWLPFPSLIKGNV